MKTLYLDIFSGISGDMFIGALIDLGVDAHALERQLGKLGLEGYHLHVSRGRKASIEGIKFDVHLAHEHGHGHEHTHEHIHEGVAHSHSHSHYESGHEHSHPHSHSPSDPLTHSHTHEHNRAFTDIKQLIANSKLSD